MSVAQLCIKCVTKQLPCWGVVVSLWVFIYRVCRSVAEQLALGDINHDYPQRQTTRANQTNDQLPLPPQLHLAHHLLSALRIHTSLGK